MRFKVKTIVEIGQELIREIRVKGNPEYQWIDIMGIPQRPEKLASSLYFGSYSDGKDGWHNAFDRRETLQSVINDKGWHAAIEEGVIVNGQHLVVSSLVTLSERLYSFSRSRNSPYVIGVTGSVGKTTAVAFLEHLLRIAGFRVVRFFSKRLTPLLIHTHYINRVEEETQIIVLEFGAFLPDQVGVLASILPPNIAFLTNIYNQHIRQDLFHDKKEIFESKIQIKSPSGMGFINSDILTNLHLNIPDGWTEFSVDTNLLSHNMFLPPTYRTAEFYTIGKHVSGILGISFDKLLEAFSSFIPKENRLTTCKFAEGTIFFDGEAPHGCRLWSWFETIDGSRPAFFIEMVDFGNDDVSTYLEYLKKLFESKMTYVLDTENNRRMVPVKANYLNPVKFGEKLNEHLSKGTYTVYHKTIKGKIPGFNPMNHLKELWGLS